MSAIEKTVPDADAPTAAHELTRQTERYALPPVDIYEEADRLVVVADLPGVTKDGLTVEVEQGILTIEGRVDRTEAAEPLRREFTLTPFFRQFRITEAVDRNRIKASLRNGVLRLELPKSEAVLPRRIPVEC